MTEQRTPAVPLRVGMYRRYSTEEQRQNSFSAEMQSDETLAAYERQYAGLPCQLRHFDDFGLSGALGPQDPDHPERPHRPGLTALLTAILNDELDVVLCYAQDRLARDEYLWHQMNATVFQPKRIPVLFARDGHDILTDEGQLVSSLHALVASLERRKISRNVSAALRRRASEGYIIGQPTYGWQWDPAQQPGPRVRRRIVRDEAQGVVLTEMKDRYLAGWLTIDIVRDLQARGIPSPTGKTGWTREMVARSLLSPIHAGLCECRGELYLGQHDPLRYWSPEERDRLLARRHGRANGVPKSRDVDRFALCGLLFCGHCGRRLRVARAPRSDQGTYRCVSSESDGPQRAKSGQAPGEVRSCPGISLPRVAAEQAVVQAIAELAQSAQIQTAAQARLEQALDKEMHQLTTELAALERQAAREQDGFSRLFRLFEQGDITEEEFRGENAKRRQQAEALEARCDQLRKALAGRSGRKEELQHARALLADFDRLWGGMTPAERRNLLLQVDNHMTVRRDDSCLTLTITPAFADPIELCFVTRSASGDPERLTPRQLAFLKLWGEGNTLEDVAKQWETSIGSVRCMARRIRLQLGAEDLDEAARMASSRIEQYRGSLPLVGRRRRQKTTLHTQLPRAEREVAQLLAQGKTCSEIAAIRGKDVSTISRQTMSLRRRLGVDTLEAAIAEARRRGLIEEPQPEPLP